MSESAKPTRIRVADGLERFMAAAGPWVSPAIVAVLSVLAIIRGEAWEAATWAELSLIIVLVRRPWDPRREDGSE